MIIKQPPENIDEMVQAGVLSKDGFIGDDTRTVAQIIAADMQTLKSLGVTCEKIAGRMKELTQKGKDLMERELSIESRYSITVRDDRGPMPDPFGGPAKRKGDTLVKDYKTGKSLRWNELVISMIEEYGFFGGNGDRYRLDPQVLIDVIGLDQ